MRSIYSSIAQKYIKTRRIRTPQLIADVEADRNLEAVEQALKLRPAIHTAVETLKINTLVHGIKVPDDLEEIIWDKNPNLALYDVREEVASANLSEADKGLIVVNILRMLHDNWVKDTSQRFFDPSWDGLQYLFMPMEVIGYKDARRFSIYIEDLLTLMSLWPEEAAIRAAYEEAQKSFLAWIHFGTRIDMSMFVTSLPYAAVSSGIRSSMRYNSGLAGSVVDQIMEHIGDISTAARAI